MNIGYCGQALRRNTVFRYDKYMTISQRNRYFKAGMFCSFVFLAGLVFYAGKLLPLYSGLVSGAAKRTAGPFQYFAARFFEAVPQVPFATAAAAAVYALAVSILIYVSFEKTHAPEILFFGLFAFSFIFEAFRLALPLNAAYNFPALFLVMSARLLLFGRFFGVLSFFAAGVYAAGYELQKQGNLVFAMLVATLVLALGIPVNVFSWDTSMVMISGYAGVFSLAETGILFLSVVSFFVAASIRGSREYFFAGLGALLAVLGRDLLLSADTWITPVPGFIMLCTGSWFLLSQLHHVYLWL
jgi:hypothetical protein